MDRGREKHMAKNDMQRKREKNMITWKKKAIGCIAHLFSDTSFCLMLWSGAQLARVGICMWRSPQKSGQSERITSLRCICNCMKHIEKIKLMQSSIILLSASLSVLFCKSLPQTLMQPRGYNPASVTVWFHTDPTDWYVWLDAGSLQVFSISLTMTHPSVGVQ